MALFCIIVTVPAAIGRSISELLPVLMHMSSQCITCRQQHNYCIALDADLVHQRNTAGTVSRKSAVTVLSDHHRIPLHLALSDVLPKPRRLQDRRKDYSTCCTDKKHTGAVLSPAWICTLAIQCVQGPHNQLIARPHERQRIQNNDARQARAQVRCLYKWLEHASAMQNLRALNYILGRAEANVRKLRACQPLHCWQYGSR